MIRVAAIAATLVLALPGLQRHGSADERPVTFPTRDVDVTYRMTGPAGRTLEQRMRWQSAQQMLRVDPPTPGLWMLMDVRHRKLALIREADRKVLDMDAPASLPMPGQPGAGATFARRGSARVAGQPCTEWETRDTAGNETVACLTSDGVLLRAAQGGQTLVEAVRVEYQAQPDAVFLAPSGFTHVQAPKG